ncbi:MAG: hypothetical protein RJA70_2680 [Pseudomonadota bacterium]|jgi:hypothetical protein
MDSEYSRDGNARSALEVFELRAQALEFQLETVGATLRLLGALGLLFGAPHCGIACFR